MDLNLIMDLLGTALLFIALFANYYFSKKSNLFEYAERAIAMAEEAYKDMTKAGGKKFEYAVDLVYTQIPVGLRVFFTREMVENTIQSVFDRMEDYAIMQLNKAAEKIESEIKGRLDGADSSF